MFADTKDECEVMNYEAEIVGYSVRPSPEGGYSEINGSLDLARSVSSDGFPRGNSRRFDGPNGKGQQSDNGGTSIQACRESGEDFGSLGRWAVCRVRR